MTECAVSKWAQSQPLASAPCGGCGQPMLYNLAVGYVGHTDAAVDPCDEPWPFEPRPELVKALFAQALTDAADVKRAVVLLDSLSIFPAPSEVPDGGYLTEEEVLPQVLTGHGRRLAFAAADRIAAGEPA